MISAESVSTGLLEEVWARALARENGYVIVEAMALLMAAMMNVACVLGLSRSNRGRNARLKVS